MIHKLICESQKTGENKPVPYGKYYLYPLCIKYTYYIEY